MGHLEIGCSQSSSLNLNNLSVEFVVIGHLAIGYFATWENLSLEFLVIRYLAIGYFAIELL